jgi:DNA-binding transcriptional ArsR family regulator
MKRDVFQAISDPTRRAIIQLLAEQQLTLNGLAAHFAISRPAVSKHIHILVECGLVEVRKQGREHYCMIKLAPLAQVGQWAEPYRQMWEDRLDRLEEYLNHVQNKEKNDGHSE